MTPTRPQPTRRWAPRARAATLAVTALLPLALLAGGCADDGGGDHPQVASLPRSEHARTTTTTGAVEGIPDPDGRPRQSLDANSLRQLQALYDPYYHCVFREHPIVSKRKDSGRYLADVRRNASLCIKLQPLPPWPLDPANPQARAFIGRTVTCMRQKGFQARAQLDSGEGIEAPEWKVVYAVGIDNASERVARIQFGCQDRARSQGPS